MRHLSIFTIIFATFATVVSAQDNPGLQLSPSSERFSQFYTPSDERLDATLRQSASYYSIKKQHASDTADCSTAKVSVFYSTGEIDGDFLVYQGNSSYDIGIEGHGAKDYGKFGILSGKAFYASGCHRGVSWNAMRFPELYLPYIITDSTGGNSKFETYCAQGGYANRFGNWHFGFDFSFYGEQAWRLTDPRVLNNTTFLKFKLSAGHIFENGNALWLSTYYMRNKQYEHDRYWRPGEQQRFFVLYGFGLYDNKESVVAFGVSRMYYINNTGVEICYLSPKWKRLTVNASINYDYKKMYTEESDITKLYNTRNHSLNPSLKVSYNAESWQLQLFSFSQILMQKGYENILERYMTDVANSTYDYRKIAEEQNYKFHNILSRNSLRFQLNITSHSTVGIEAGALLTDRLEQNTKYHYKVVNLNIMPTAKADITVQTQNGKHNFTFEIQYGHQKSVKHNYDVEIKNSSIPHVDFQTCFAPFAYYAAEFDMTASQLRYQYNFAKFSIGITASGFVINGERIEGSSYTKTIGYNSVCPMIDPIDDNHNEKWFNTSIFVTF